MTTRPVSAGIPRVVVYSQRVIRGPIHAGVCGLALLGATTVACAAAGGADCEIYTNETDFLAAVAAQRLTAAGVEDFEYPASNLGPSDFAALADPLVGGVLNVDPESGLGFPTGLSSALLRLQSNIVQQNADATSPGSGLAAIGPGFLDPKTMDPDSVQVGADADMVVVDLDKEVTVDKQHIFSRSGWSLIEGHTFTGWPVMTILRGKVVVEWPDGEDRPRLVGEARGEYVPRKPGHQQYPLDPIEMRVNA